MKPDITTYIIRRLSRAAVEDDIIYAVCQKTGMDWEDAQALVAQVQLEHREEIDARQTPVKGLLTGVFFVLGAMLTVMPVIYLWILFDVTRTFLVFLSSPSTMNMETAIQLFLRRCALLSWFELPSIIFSILVGLAILYANLQPMIEVWETLFRERKDAG
jgi:hypothetical protein